MIFVVERKDQCTSSMVTLYPMRTIIDDHRVVVVLVLVELLLLQIESCLFEALRRTYCIPHDYGGIIRLNSKIVLVELIILGEHANVVSYSTNSHS